MIRIRGPTSLLLIPNLALRELVELRMSQLADGEPYDPDRHGELWVVQEADTAEAVEEAADVFLITNPIDGSRFGEPEFTPSFEFAEHHASELFELLFVLSDAGAVAIFISPTADPELIRYCETYAVPAAVPPR